MQNIAQADSRKVKLMVNIRESYRRRLKAEAARLGKEMGAVIEDALDKMIGPPPKETKTEVGDVA